MSASEPVLSRKQPVTVTVVHAGPPSRACAFGGCGQGAFMAGCNLRHCGAMKVMVGASTEPARCSATSSSGHFYRPRGR